MYLVVSNVFLMWNNQMMIIVRFTRFIRVVFRIRRYVYRKYHSFDELLKRMKTSRKGIDLSFSSQRALFFLDSLISI